MSEETNNGANGYQKPNTSDDMDGNACFYFTNPKKLTAKTTVEKKSRHYNMKHKRRGMAIIFNHETYHEDYQDPRPGTNRDGNNLENELRRLGFHVVPLNNKRYAEIYSYLEQTAKIDHSQSDCLVIAVLTHGDQGKLYAYDTHYKTENLWSLFTADNCPSLAGKPKLFFIQACQGKKYDDGITLRYTATDGPVLASYKIPLHSDFLIAFSTVPGYYSWRNTTRGSWFIQALCEELRESGTDADILTIMTFVNQRVALDFESDVPHDLEAHEKKQSTCFTSMLTRLLVFGNK